jgi:hypothetical protein
VLFPFAPWHAWQTIALVAPVWTFPAGLAALLTIAPQIIVAIIQSRFMIARNPM